MGSDVISYVTIKQSPTTWCQKLYPLPLHTITLSPLNVSMSSYLKGNHNFCNLGGSLMKDPGKWNGSIDYINGTMVGGIIPRYQEEGKWMR